MIRVRTSLFVNVNDLTGNEILRIFSNTILIDEFNIKNIIKIYFNKYNIPMNKSQDYVIDICPYWLEKLPTELEKTINFKLTNTLNNNLVTIVNTYYK